MHLQFPSNSFWLRGIPKPYGYIFPYNNVNSNVSTGILIFYCGLHGAHRMSSAFLFLKIIFREDQCGMENELPSKATFLRNGSALRLGLVSILPGSLGLLSAIVQDIFTTWCRMAASGKFLVPLYTLICASPSSGSPRSKKNQLVCLEKERTAPGVFTTGRGTCMLIEQVGVLHRTVLIPVQEPHSINRIMHLCSDLACPMVLPMGIPIHQYNYSCLSTS